MKTTFKSWAAAYGGPFKLAADLGVAYHTLYNWLNNRGRPKADTVLKIVALSKGAVTAEMVLNECRINTSRRKAAVNARARRA